MKKKLLTVVVLIALVMVPSFAKSSDMSLGLALGTRNGVGYKYHIDKDLTVGGTVGFDALSSNNLNVEAFGLYKVMEFQIEKLEFDVNAGAGAALSIPLSASSAFGIALLGMAEVSYSFDSKDLPIDVLLRLEPGVSFAFVNPLQVGFAFQGSLQGLYRFDL